MGNRRANGLRRRALVLPATLLATALMPISDAVKADAPNAAYTYDAQGRLKSACDARQASGDLTVYRYDKAGNRSAYIHSRTDQVLSTGGYILSADGRFQLVMQSDGNLVLYSKSGSTLTPLGWSTNTVGSGATVAAFQSDGNFVLYTGSGSVWNSNTANNHCATLLIQNDGNMIIKNVSGNIVWQTNTGGH